MDALVARLDLVEEALALAGQQLSLLRPRSSEALLDEAAFEREEFLPYWAELWPSGLALARAVESIEVVGARVLELGCGLALPSFAAALGGADVLATDWSPDAVELVRANAERNGVVLQVARVPWEQPAPLLAGAPWELVLAADVLYERRNADALLELLPRLVDERGTVLLADPGRPAAGGFFAAAEERWTVERAGSELGGSTIVNRLRMSLGR